MEDFNLIGHIYRIHEWEGEPVETEEMSPQWYKLHEIPYDEMWIDDKYWLPLFLERKHLKAYFRFKDNLTLLEKDINLIER